MNKDKYIVDGRVARDKIVMDIKYCRISRQEILNLCEDKDVQAVYIGRDYPDKKPKREWNKDYLGLLSYASVAESFNKDYLLYLNEVAQYVAKAKYKKIVVAGIIIILVIVAGVIVRTYVL